MNDKVIPFDKPIRIKLIDDALEEIEPLILKGALIVYELMRRGLIKDHKKLKQEIQFVWDKTGALGLDGYPGSESDKRLWGGFMDIWDQAFTNVYDQVENVGLGRLPIYYKCYEDQDFVIDFMVARIDDIKNGY